MKAYILTETTVKRIQEALDTYQEHFKYEDDQTAFTSSLMEVINHVWSEGLNEVDSTVLFGGPRTEVFFVPQLKEAKTVGYVGL